jgi:tRNA threonylcarbamoyladenosine biosynthesis protein TsaB
MHSYIAIQNTYDIFEMALFVNNNKIDHIHEDKRHTSKMFIPFLDQLCIRNNILFSNISFCAVNCGPGPFSTLRSIIASVNGLHLATNVPLISIDGLEATFLEFYDKQYQNTIVLLNAFNNEVYYLIFTPSTYSPSSLLFNGVPKWNRMKFGVNGDPKKEVKNAVKGYKKIDLFLAEIKQKFTNQPIHFIGNGVTLYYDLIQQMYGDRAVIKENIPPMCSLETIGKLGLHAFLNNQQANDFLMPLHLKKHAVEM